MNVGVYIFNSSDRRVSGVCLRSTRRLNGGVTRGNCGLIFNTKGCNVVNTSTQNTCDTNNRAVKIAPSFFVSINIIFSGYSRLVMASAVHRHGNVVRSGTSTFMVYTNNVNAFRRFFRILALGRLGERAGPVVVCGMGNCCGSVLTVLSGTMDRGFVTGTYGELCAVTSARRKIFGRLRGCIPFDCSGCRFLGGSNKRGN